MFVCHTQRFSEGRCYIDRYFGALSCLERVHLLKSHHIQGILSFYDLTYNYLGPIDYVKAWMNKIDSTFYNSTLDRSSAPLLLPFLDGAPAKQIRQITFVDSAFYCRLVCSRDTQNYVF